MPIDTEDVIALVDAALSADYTRVRRTGSKIANALKAEDEESSKRLRSLIRRRGVPLRASGYSEMLPVDGKSRLPLIEEQQWPATPVFLDSDNQAVFADFLNDVTHVDLLAAKGLASRLCMMLSGPPGTGKTLLAGHIAAQLRRPLYVVRLDSAISSLLGDTAKNVRSIFDFVTNHNGVLFLDEMDAIAKLRNDQHELGELKRVVNTVIQGLDSIDDQTVVIAATNHPQLLDPAIWRRFPYRIDLGIPALSVRESLWRHFLMEDDTSSPLPKLLAQISEGITGADLRNIALAARRHSVYDDKPLDIASVAWATLTTINENLALPGRGGISKQRRLDVAHLLKNDVHLNQSDTAKLLGVSRQAVSSYLKE